MNNSQITPDATATVAYDGTAPIKYELVRLGLIKPKSDDIKQSALLKVARLALGMPIDTRGGKNAPADNIALVNWCASKVALGLTAKEIIIKGKTPDNAPAPQDAELLPVDTELVGDVDISAVDTTTPSNEIAEYKQTECFEPTTAQTLEELAIEINYLNAKVENHYNQAVIFAAQTGEKLLLAKAQCNHGEFGAWLLANCNVSQSYANSFMRLARSNSLDSNLQTTFNLNLNQTIELLSAPEKVKLEVIAKIDAGENVTVSEIKQLKKQSAKVENEPVDLVSQVESLEPAPAIIETIEPPTELKNVEVGAIEVDNTAIKEVHYCLETIESHLITAQFSDKWRVELAEYKRIGAIFESLVH